jgi:uncharacterized membrane protein YqjE
MEAEKEEANSKVDRLLGNIVEVAETRFDLVAINIQDKMTEIFATGATFAIVGVLFFFTLMLASIGVAIFLSDYFNSSFMGFLCIAGFYLLLAFVVYLNRKTWIKLPVVNTLLKKINFHEED